LLNAPGSIFLYSDLNFMTLMIVLETVTGRSLDVLVGEFTSLLDMESTFFNRGNVEGDRNPFYRRTATEEFQIEVEGNVAIPDRPQPVVVLSMTSTLGR
jgi:CubicO group peptidase (beta-lactamase class C family)